MITMKTLILLDLNGKLEITWIKNRWILQMINLLIKEKNSKISNYSIIESVIS